MRVITKLGQVTRFQMLLVAASLALLVFAIYWVGYVGGQGALVPPIGNDADGRVSRWDGPSIDGPFIDAERVGSVSEAQARLSFEIPLPPELVGEWEPSVVWVSPEDRPEDQEQLRITFANGVDVAVHTQSRTNIRAAAEDHADDFDLVQVGAWDAMVHNRGTKTIHGQTFEEPSSVGWWQNGTYLVLYSHEHSKELLAMAPLFARAPEGELEPIPPADQPLPTLPSRPQN